MKIGFFLTKSEERENKILKKKYFENKNISS